VKKYQPMKGVKTGVCQNK